VKGLRFALQQPSGAILALTRSLKIKGDLAGKGYDSARPALTADGAMNEASQKKALDMVLKSAGVKEAPPLERFFNFAITRKVIPSCNPRAGSPRHNRESSSRSNRSNRSNREIRLVSID
jgi:hypothetical protein